jgi:rare lipoprotein A
MTSQHSFWISALGAALLALPVGCQRKPQAAAIVSAEEQSHTQNPAHSPKSSRARKHSEAPATTTSEEKKRSKQEATEPKFEEQPEKTSEGIATWYDVPEGSLPERRAAPGEMTAAHDTLPIGTYVRVTDQKNGRSVIVQITDRGVHDKGAIDLCKEAAKEIHLVGRGRTHVQLDVLKPKESIASEAAKNLPVAAPALPTQAAGSP